MMVCAEKMIKQIVVIHTTYSQSILLIAFSLDFLHEVTERCDLNLHYDYSLRY